MKIETDVLVIGGGGAAARAAIEAPIKMVIGALRYARVLWHKRLPLQNDMIFL